MNEQRSLPSPDDLLAAELALGVLDEKRPDAEARLASDADFAAAFERWTAHFMGLFTGSGEAPPPALWRHIERSLPANDSALVRHGDAALPWWRAGALTGFAATVILATILASRNSARPFPQVAIGSVSPQLVATLSDDKRAAVVTVDFDPPSGQLLLAPSRLNIGAHSAELWVIAGGRSPHSLGTIAAQRPSRQPVPPGARALLAPDATLAISLEPLGGSPTGAPTGPVILSGKIVAL